ncbi:hypothetical protein [Ruminobacter amylophilus]|nr:hypothetical protein [Ruminobacter amylophilus]
MKKDGQSPAPKRTRYRKKTAGFVSLNISRVVHPSGYGTFSLFMEFPDA